MDNQSITFNKQGAMEVRLLVAIIKDEDYYVAYCPALDLSSYAKDVNSAKKAFSEALNIFFKETMAKGTLEKLLLSYGWTLQPKQYQPPAPSAELMNRFCEYPPVSCKEERFKIAFA